MTDEMTHPSTDSAATAEVLNNPRSTDNVESTAGEPGAATRWAIYRLFILASCVFMIARILIVESASGESPFLSANDRSRWCTIRALGDEQTYIIDDIILPPGSDRFDPEWNTIDKVYHKGLDGQEHYYSSKPTLYTTMLAGEYVFLNWLTDWTLGAQPFKMARLMLIITNVIPMAFFFVLMGFVVERFAKRNWTRMFVMASTTFGTFLTSFAITLNNHLPAAVSVMACVYCLLAIWGENRKHWGYFFAAGLAAGFAAANELPALSFLVAAFCVVTIKMPRQSLLGFVPGVAVIATGFFLTNYLAHQDLRPPYMHRDDGPRIAVIEFDLAKDLERGNLPPEVRQALDQSREQLDFTMSDEAVIRPALKLGPNDERRWEIWDPKDNDRLAIVESVPNTAFEIRKWDNWYEYETSYWLPGRRGPIDQGEPSMERYAFHMSFGHHGYFSLTPIWLISLCGLLFCATQRNDKMQLLALMTLALFAVCFVFYAIRPEGDRNYGGVTSGLRWLFWFAPLFLVGLIPICDRLGRLLWFQLLAEVCLAVSIFSWLYTPLNPWVHPWLYAWFVPPA